MAGVEKSYSFIAPAKEIDVELTVKRSRFIGSVRISLDPDDASEKIKGFPEIFPKANHHCWAYRIGTENILEHCSDAGEPAGTAGRPILGMLKRHSLQNTLLVVTRYFGGIKLGVRGLIEAYGEAAELAVTEAGSVEMELNLLLDLSCSYEHSKTLSSSLKKWGFGEDRISALYGENVEMSLYVPSSLKPDIAPSLEEMFSRGMLQKLEWGNSAVPMPRDKQ
ncbi:MAG: IMPACT family protein [Synergistaceae bacterium]|nr:IMPACT family protein [Synergistaceae bacterium]MDD2351041.1 IMPACT family protein [Synergistaceae bacterium]MDD3319518.1 IMPACT family protein [Synergistaceae bacterium]MDD3672919.1 IMPACT family protein [Synergistaceae bacterium]MDD3964240.1 IMPACT family protein [Synergistaceae bacterium]